MSYPLIAIVFLTLVLFPDCASADSCISVGCHQGFRNLSTLHEPVKAENGCFSCHIRTTAVHPVREKAHVLVAEKQKLCEKCHAPFSRYKSQHKPVQAGECTSCHDPHGSSGAALLPVRKDLTSLCIKCHDQSSFSNSNMHGPVAVGACNACHDAHESSENALLRMPTRETCYSCHADFKATATTSPVVHAPIAKSDCTACHTPHSSKAPHLLKMELRQLCIHCHTKFEEKLTGKVVHKPIEQDDSCCSCHAPHFSNAKALLPSSGQAMCLECHGKTAPKGMSLRNIETELKGKKVLHGPVREGNCQACHDPHSSPYYRLLKGSYPSTMYAPYKEGLYDGCLICHERNLLRYQETTVYTMFRNGKTNLHFTHVANRRKGRTCRMCHEPHASDGDKLINKESMKFGVWRIPVNLTLTPTGGKCLPGCHREFAYDRDKPVIYRRMSSNRKSSGANALSKKPGGSE